MSPRGRPRRRLQQPLRGLRAEPGGIPCAVYEADSTVGGLAGSFQIEGTDLEMFYLQWFTSDELVMGIVKGLGLGDRLVKHASRTGLLSLP